MRCTGRKSSAGSVALELGSASRSSRKAATFSSPRALTSAPAAVAWLPQYTAYILKKGSSVFVNLSTLKRCLRHEINPQWNLLVGFPLEEEEVFEKYEADLERLVHLHPPDGTFPVRFDRFSPYFMQREEYGLDLHAYDYYKLIYPFDEESLQELAYYFMDENYDAEYFTTMIRHLVPLRQVVASWLERWDGVPGSERGGRRSDWVQPKLYLASEDASGGVIHDSRGAEAVEHRLSAPAVSILRALEEPRHKQGLAELAAETGADLDAELAGLDERGLLWEEHGRLLNLTLLEPY